MTDSGCRGSVLYGYFSLLLREFEGFCLFGLVGCIIIYVAGYFAGHYPFSLIWRVSERLLRLKAIECINAGILIATGETPFREAALLFKTPGFEHSSPSGIVDICKRNMVAF